MSKKIIFSLGIKDMNLEIHYRFENKIIELGLLYNQLVCHLTNNIPSLG